MPYSISYSNFTEFAYILLFIDLGQLYYLIPGHGPPEISISSKKMIFFPLDFLWRPSNNKKISDPSRKPSFLISNDMLSLFHSISKPWPTVI